MMIADNLFCRYAGMAAIVIGASSWLTGCQALPLRKQSSEKMIASRELTRLGQEAMHAGQWEQARVRFEHALKICPHDPQSRHHLAQVLWSLGEQNRAIKEMDFAVRQSADDPAWTVELGEMLMEQRAFPAAAECARRALERDGQLADAWVLQGKLQRLAGDQQGALDSFYRAIACGACHPTAAMQLAELQHNLGRPDRALSVLTNLQDQCGVDGQSSHAARLHGLVLQDLNRHADAIEKFQLAQRWGDGTNDLRLMLAQSLIATGQTTAASEQIQLVIAVQPNHPQAIRLASYCDGSEPQASRIETF